MRIAGHRPDTRLSAARQQRTGGSMPWRARADGRACGFGRDRLVAFEGSGILNEDGPTETPRHPNTFAPGWKQPYSITEDAAAKLMRLGHAQLRPASEGLHAAGASTAVRADITQEPRRIACVSLVGTEAWRAIKAHHRLAMLARGAFLGRLNCSQQALLMWPAPPSLPDGQRGFNRQHPTIESAGVPPSPPLGAQRRPSPLTGEMRSPLLPRRAGHSRLHARGRLSSNEQPRGNGIHPQHTHPGPRRDDVCMPAGVGRVRA
eukprot:364635-Chlamydomonas_euryale.AAC.14